MTKKTEVPAGTDPYRDTGQFCAGKVAISIEVKVTTREMQDWPPARVRALFEGIAMVERAMAGAFESKGDEPC